MKLKEIYNIKIKLDKFLPTPIMVYRATLILGVSVALILSGITTYKINKIPVISIIAVNKITDSYLQHLARREINEEQRETIVAKFSKTLEKELRILAKETGGVVLVDEAVIEGGIDLTPILAKRVREMIRE